MKKFIEYYFEVAEANADKPYIFIPMLLTFALSLFSLGGLVIFGAVSLLGAGSLLLIPVAFVGITIYTLWKARPSE